MCILGNVALHSGVSTMAPVVPVTTASSAGLVQIMKPKLPRKITKTPKINLNKYWNLFEDIMNENGRDSSPSSSQPLRFDDIGMDNEINENISNEQKEIEENMLVMRNNERNSLRRAPTSQRCTCHFCLISDLRNVTVSERDEEVTEL